jgi:hypothetical protein
MIQGLGKNIPWFYFNIKIAGLSRKNSSQEKTALRDLRGGLARLTLFYLRNYS